MARAETKRGAGLCVGVSEYLDRKLEGCPAALASARDMQQALDARFFPGVQILLNPRSSDELFRAIQRSIREASEGVFCLYFAGFAMRRGSELLLTVGESQTDGAKSCVPWADINDLLQRENVAEALVVLNTDHFSGAPSSVSAADGVTVLGSGRSFAPSVGNTRMRGFADVALEALRSPAASLAKYLNDGKLDAEGLGRFLVERTPKPLRAQVFALGSRCVIVRDPSLEPVAPAPEPPPATEPAVAEEPAPKAETAIKLTTADELESKPPVKTELVKRPSNLPMLLVLALVLCVVAALYWVFVMKR